MKTQLILCATIALVSLGTFAQETLLKCNVTTVIDRQPPKHAVVPVTISEFGTAGFAIEIAGDDEFNITMTSNSKNDGVFSTGVLNTSNTKTWELATFTTNTTTDHLQEQHIQINRKSGTIKYWNQYSNKSSAFKTVHKLNGTCSKGNVANKF